MAAGYTEAAGSLTNQAATLFVEKANRRALVIGNPSDTAMTYRFGSTDASATAGIPLAPGDTHRYEGENCPSAKITIYCAGAAKAYTGYEA